MNIAGLSIGQPWVLWGLLLCPLLVLLAWRSRLDATARQRRVVLLARVLVVALLVLALADARLRLSTRALAVGFVVDESTSVSPAEVRVLRGRTPRERIERDDVRWLEPALGPAALARETNLAALIDSAVGVLATDRVRRVVLATDGRETQGDVLAAAERAQRVGARVFVLPVGDHPAVDRVALVGVDTPRLVRAGRDITVGVRVFAATAQPVRIELYRDAQLVSNELVSAPAGASLHDVSVSFADEGVHELVARVSADGDALEANNRYRALVRVVTPPKVLLVHEVANGAPSLATVYRDAHLHVDEVWADGVPSDVNGLERYQFVVLDELVLTSLSEAQQRALRGWVEERGGGLLTTTGMHGVGREPAILREIEPIMPPRSVPEPRPIELILVIDRSGSMQGPGIVNARAAGIAAVRALRSDSRVGVVGFSGEPDVVVAPEPVENAERVVQAIAGLRASGGTDLAAALNAAARIVTDDDRYLHHVIVLSDGESNPAPAIAAATALRETGATITAITLGRRASLMSQISQLGRGRYHVTNRATSLPALFVREAQFRNPPPAREVAYRPLVSAHMGFLDGVNFAADPPIGGFVVAQERPGSLTVLQTPERSPLLSHWFVGLGQVATLTTATTSRWADAWRTGEGFRRLFSQMAWEMLRQQSEDNLEMHVERVPGRSDLRRVSVVAPSVAREPMPIVSLSRGRSVGVPLPMRPTAPGVWESTVAVEEGFVVDARLPSSLEPTVAVGAETPYPAELRSFGADAPALEAIARAGGGRVLRSLDEALDHVDSERVVRDVRLPLLSAALVLYLLSILALRVSDRARTAPLRKSPVEGV